MMPATDPELTSMEDPHAVENEKGGLTNTLPSVPPMTIPASAPPFPTTITNFTGKAVIENRAVSMASNDCSSALSSPAEASPAKPAAVTSPTTLEGTVEASPATSHIASASDSLQCTRTSLVSIPETLQPLTLVPSPTFGCPDVEKDFPTSLTFKGITVTLENSSVWKQFHSCGTEMILTKQGRRMFPYCRYRLSGLDPERQYSLVLSIVPFDKHKYRWNKTQWEVGGRGEHEPNGMVRAFVHHYLSCKGSDWMGSLVSFYKLKLTNNSADSDGHIILHSMHRYIPRLHVIPVPDGVTPTPDCPVVIGPECIIFTFPQTEFMAVTTYQNFRVTQLKINYNPFAKGFREDGNNPRLHRVIAGVQPAVKKVTEPIVIEENESREEAVDLSMKNHIAPAPVSNVQATRLVLKPIMSTPASNNEPYVPCIRGKHALGELVLVQNRPLAEPMEENHTPKAISTTPTSTTSTPKALPWSRRKRKRINRRWANSRGKEWKAATAAAASPKVVHSPSLTVALQPELDDVEGLLFISFTSKEALDVHVRNKPASSSAPLSPVSPMSQKQPTQTVEVISETVQEKISHLAVILLQDLRVLRHRQVIHPVLQEVGLKLSSIDLTKSIDLHYLGVSLPLPPITQPERCDATALSPADKRLPFISRTGKTSDMTKIKGWRNKFIKSKETSSSDSDGLQRNLSAFCSNMLDEYLESEAQQISERAAAFSTNPEGSVAYQLPAKSSSYVKTLDSALKHRNAASTFSSGASRPCPLSHKPLLYSALTSSAPPLTSSATPVQATAQSLQSSHMHSGASLASNAASQRSPSYHPSVSQKPVMNSGQNQGMVHRPTGLTKLQMNILQMEIAALNQGVNRTQLTQDRVSEALSVILTKQMFYSPNVKAPKYQKNTVEGPECGKEFCRLGCVCSSLQQLNRGPLHCRRPECMFGCGCFKRKITKHISAGDKEQIQPVYSMTNMVNLVQPHPGSHSKKLWNCNIRDVDPEPLSTPKTSQCPLPPKAPRGSGMRHPTPPVREEDKDPVYRYLESMMTCARVREFNSLPPPEVTIEPKIVDTTTPSTNTKQKKTTTDDQPRHYYRTVKSRKPADGSGQESTASEAEARKQIQIQSACQWDKDHKMVLESLCRRMNQNRLSQRFYIGPYRISPVSKIFMKKPSGSIVTYRVLISKPSKASDNEEDESDESDEEKLTNKSFDGDINAEQEEDGQIEEPEITYGVIPFLSGVLPAGRLRVSTKPAGCQVSGLIQVNGKCYNQARLLLGNMGSLHPANRLAAYVTGRLHAPADTAHKDSQKPNPTLRNNTPGTLRIKATGTVIPPIFSAKPTTDLKIQTPALAQLQPDALRKGFTSLPQVAQNLSIFNPLRSFISSQLRSGNPHQTSSMSSPVSLTVSPSLKTPSFLGHSGTYSFRICPPTNQNTGAQNLPGVALPGGFTLFQLPKPGADGATQKPETVNTTDIAAVDKALSPRGALFNFVNEADLDTNWLGLDILNESKNLCSSMSVEPSSSSELTCNAKMPSEESDEVDSRQVESNLDIASEGESSDSSDYCGDEDEDKVDVETVEELGQQMAIAKMREAVKRMLQETRNSSDDAGAGNEVSTKDQMDVDVVDKKRRTNHTALERQRRSEQRGLFDKLQIVLRSHPGSSRHHLLTMALREIQNLVKTSKCLEEKKKELTDMQSTYLKELALLSGKSEILIKHKLTDICKKQKMREQAVKWRPVFSHLLQSRAALLQANTAQPTVKPPPLLQPNFYIAKPAAQNSVHQEKSQLQPNPQRNHSSVHTPVCPPTQKSEPEGHQEAPEAPAQGTQSQVLSVPSVPHITAAQDGPLQLNSTPIFQNLSVQPPKPMTLPLIRSKTGRLILPSSLKPLGQGFYTLTYMETKQIKEGEVSTSANTQPSGVDSKSQDKSISAPQHPSGSENRCLLEEDKTKPSNSDPECSATTAPLSALNFVKSLYQHSAAAEKKQEGGTAASLNKAPSAVCLNFNLKKASNSAIAQPNRNPPTMGRRRGRPRKNRLPPEGENRNHPVAEETRKSEPTETQADDTPVIDSVPADKPAPDHPVPVKRRRGRPPKNRAHPGQPAAQGGSGSSKSNEDKPFIPVCGFKIPDIGPNADPAATTSPGEIKTSRPLTRGALGKDFPSAKKRSWIDIEKELDPELEYE